MAGVSSAIAFVKYIATFWSPSGSVDALKSVVGYTSDELSILLILFAIKFTDALPKSITGETFGLSVDNSKSRKNDFADDNSFCSFILDAIILELSNVIFSPRGIATAFADVTVENDVSFPLGLVADVVLTFGNINVPVSSKT